MQNKTRTHKKDKGKTQNKTKLQTKTTKKEKLQNCKKENIQNKNKKNKTKKTKQQKQNNKNKKRPPTSLYIECVIPRRRRRGRVGLAGLQLGRVGVHALVGRLQRFGRLECLARVLARGQQFRRALPDADLDVDLLLQIVLLFVAKGEIYNITQCACRLYTRCA